MICKTNKLALKSMYMKNMNKIVFETICSSVGAAFSNAVMTVFWNSVGMNQTDIGFVQMIFTIVILFLDIPLGYLADRFNRKILNVIGDIGVAAGFILYAVSQNMIMCIIAEALLGVFLAMTNGVDQSFLKATCNKVDSTGAVFRKVNIKLQTAKYITFLIVTVIGGIVAKFSIRASIFISFVPYFLGGIVAIFIVDYSEKYERKHKNPVKDIFKMYKEILKNKQTRAYIISYVIGREITHPQIWVFTPLLMLVGVPLEIVSLSYVLNHIMQIIGSMLSKKLQCLNIKNQFIIPVIIELSWMLILIINVNIVTVWIMSLNGLVMGLLGANMTTALQSTANNKVQAALMSLASTISRLLYMPLVFFINFLGNIKYEYAFVGMIIVFVPLSIFAYYKLNKIEKY